MSYQPVPALGKDWLTPFYDVLLALGGLGAPLTKRVFERAHIQDGERVLDVGCATATRLIAAKARYPTAHSIPSSADRDQTTGHARHLPRAHAWWQVSAR